MHQLWKPRHPKIKVVSSYRTWRHSAAAVQCWTRTTLTKRGTGERRVSWAETVCLRKRSAVDAPASFAWILMSSLTSTLSSQKCAGCWQVQSVGQAMTGWWDMQTYSMDLGGSSRCHTGNNRAVTFLSIGITSWVLKWTFTFQTHALQRDIGTSNAAVAWCLPAWNFSLDTRCISTQSTCAKSLFSSSDWDWPTLVVADLLLPRCAEGGFVTICVAPQCTTFFSPIVQSHLEHLVSVGQLPTRFSPWQNGGACYVGSFHEYKFWLIENLYLFGSMQHSWKAVYVPLIELKNVRSQGWSRFYCW